MRCCRLIAAGFLQLPVALYVGLGGLQVMPPGAQLFLHADLGSFGRRSLGKPLGELCLEVRIVEPYEQFALVDSLALAQ